MSTGKKVVLGTVWSSIDRFGNMAIQFVVNMVLANLILPVDFGYIGILAIFMAVSQVLIGGGFATALIQKKSPTQTDYSTIFFWNVGLSACLYLTLFAFAPLIAGFFRQPILTDVLRTFGIMLIFSALSQVHAVRLRKQMAFRTIAIVNIVSYSAAGLTAIYLAVRGFGVWALVTMQLVNTGLAFILYFIVTRWHPSAVFSKHALKSMFNFGGYLLAAGLLQEICKNIPSIIIGRRFSATQMGYYSQANKLDQINSYAVPQALVQAIFPYYSQIQDDRDRLAMTLLRCIRVIAFCIFPVLGLLIIAAPDLIVLLWGEEWLPAAPYFRILCCGGIFTCLQNINFYAVAARGQSKDLFRWSFYKWGVLTALLLGGMFLGMEGIMWAFVVSNANIYTVNALLAQRHTGLRFTRQLRGWMPTALATAVSVGIAFFTGFLSRSGLLGGAGLSMMVASFIICYACIVALFNFRATEDVCSILRQIINRKKSL